MEGRRKPYTPRGIQRVPCARCGAPSVHQWQCCANGNRWMGLCLDCDIGLNEAALNYIKHPQRKRLMAAYRAKL